MSVTPGSELLCLPADALREFVAWVDGRRIAAEQQTYADPTELDASDQEFLEQLRGLGLPQDFIDEVLAA